MNWELNEKAKEVAQEIMEFGNAKDYCPITFMFGCTKVLKALWKAKPDSINHEALLRDLLLVFFGEKK